MCLYRRLCPPASCLLVLLLASSQFYHGQQTDCLCTTAHSALTVLSTLDFLSLDCPEKLRWNFSFFQISPSCEQCWMCDAVKLRWCSLLFGADGGGSCSSTIIRHLLDCLIRGSGRSNSARTGGSEGTDGVSAELQVNQCKCTAEVLHQSLTLTQKNQSVCSCTKMSTLVFSCSHSTWTHF